MKKIILLLPLLFLITICNLLSAQSATATWPLTSSATVNVSASGAVTASAEVRGPVFPAPSYNNRTIYGTSTSVSTQNITVNPGGVGTSSTSAHNNGGYVQFSVTSQAGYEFTASTISFYMGAGNANSNGTSVEYSLNSDFSSPVVLGTPSGSTAFPSRDVLYPFSYSLPGVTLASGKTLYLRIYAWNGSTTARLLLLHNLVISGTTSTPKPTVTTSAASSITPTSVSIGGTVVNDGGSSVTERGIVYSTTANPTTAHTKVVDASGGTGSFSSSITGLEPSTTYHIRAYAINSAGTAYGNNVTFSTSDEVVTTPKQMEYLTRGVVAVRSASNQVYVGWRLLGNDPAKTAFNVYRDGVRLNASPITTSTNYVDNTSANGTYTVKPVINGVEGAASTPVPVWGKNQLSIPLQIPAGGISPDGVSYDYSANDCSVGDVDGDGEYEIFVKWDPSNSKDNSQSGYTGNVYIDCYKLNGTHLWRVDLGRNIRAGAHYTQFIVYDLDGDGRAEMACKTADGTVDGTDVTIGNPLADYRNSGGYVLSGPEFLTVFNGLTGAAMATTNYLPARGTVSSWGDNYGNRVDRFVAAVAYLDGARPSLVMGRGYYTRLVRVAWDWRNGQLTHRWTFDSNTSGNGAYAGQGNHQMTVGDVDGDGKDEIFNGSSAINDNGKTFWSNNFGHGDALHMTDMDPDRPGQEIWQCLEDDGSYGPYGLRLNNAQTGMSLWGIPTSGDIGRAMAADIDPSHKGYEVWGSSGGVYNVKGQQITTNRPTINHGLWWDGDLSRELLDGTVLDKWNPATNSSGRLFTIYNAAPVSSNNSTKKNPGLTADLLGDWREEMIFRTSDNTALILFTTTIPTEHRIHTLMHDPQYRVAVAWQNSGYNQPPYPSFYLGNDMTTPPMPNIAVTDIAPPAVTSISRLNPAAELTNATTITYRVSFSENVLGVDVSDFTLTTTGSVAGTIASVSAASGAYFDVTVNDITGDGTLRLDVMSSKANITDESNNSYSEDFTAGALYDFDHTAPLITNISVNKPVLPVPNHKMEEVTVNYDVTDRLSFQVTLSITSNETGNGLGDGNMASDWSIMDNHHVRLRAERSGKGSDRVYTISITATDLLGNSRTETVTVTVPHDHKVHSNLPSIRFTEEARGQKEMHISAYPNPSAQYFTFHIQSGSNTPVTVIITDVAGRIIETRNGVAANSSLTVGSSWRPGIYFVQAVQEGEKQVLRLVKKADQPQ